MEIEYFDTDVIAAINELSATVLKYVGSIALLLLVATGIYYAAGSGDVNRQVTAKRSAGYIIFGLIIILVSYSILVVIDNVVTK